MLDKAAVTEPLLRRMARSDIMAADDAKVAGRLQSCALFDNVVVAERLQSCSLLDNVVVAERLQSCFLRRATLLETTSCRGRCESCRAFAVLRLARYGSTRRSSAVLRIARSGIISADDAKAAERLQSCALLDTAAVDKLSVWRMA